MTGWTLQEEQLIQACMIQVRNGHVLDCDSSCEACTSFVQQCDAMPYSRRNECFREAKRRYPITMKVDY